MLPERFGRYQVQAEIGRGAMGRVYRGIDPLVGRAVAIKAIQPDELPRKSRDELLRRFRREAQAAGGLTHPHIVTIYDVGENYFVMEFVEGITLSSHLSRRDRLVPTEALALIAPIAGALDYAHRRGVIHRDVKPANIMICRDGTPKLMDFGLAHLDATVLTRAGQSLGSPAYMPPEQITGTEDLTPPADVYSLAVVTYEMLTGARPFQGKNITSILYRVVHDAPLPPRKFNGSLPPRYDELFERALAKAPSQRFPDAHSFLAELSLKEFEVAAERAMTSAAAIVSSSVDPPRAQPGGAFHEQATMDLRGVAGAQASPRGEATASVTERRRTARRWTEWRAIAGVGALIVVGLAALLLSRFAGETETVFLVDSLPSGARVWLDGREVGVTPIELRELSEDETHEVTAEKDGFMPQGREVTLAAGSVLFALQPARTSLSLKSTPESASVSIDGREVGRSPIDDLPLEPGSHHIEVQRRGFRAWKVDVEPKRGESLYLVARLEALPRRQSKAAPPPEPTIPAKAIAELGSGVVPPKKIEGEFASYPEMARRRRIGGSVTVEMIITEKGLPSEITIIESGGELLDRAFLEAIATWRYRPATRNGEAVAIRWRVRQHFRIGS